MGCFKNEMKIIIIFLLLSFFSSKVFCESNFTLVQIADGVTVSLPKNWIVLSNNTRTTIDAYVEATGNKKTESSLAFTANLYNENGETIALINFRAYPQNIFTQIQLQELQNQNLDEMRDGIIKSLKQSLDLQNLKFLQWKSLNIRKINGYYVLQHEHLQEIGSPKIVWHSVALRIWNSPKSFTITLGYNDKMSTLLAPIIEKISTSLIIKQ